MEKDAGPHQLTMSSAVDSSTVMAIADPAEPVDPADPERSGEAVTTSAEDNSTAYESATSDAPGTPAAANTSGASRLSNTWLAAIAVALMVLAGALGTAGYFALHAHQAAQSIARADAAAVTAAQQCLAATQPPNAAALATSQQKLSECSTRAFGAQIAWYSTVLAQAYQTVNFRIQVPDMRAAVERHNDDGSVVVLVAFRAAVSQGEMANRENSYRLRLKMVPEDGQFKIAELDQVGK